VTIDSLASLGARSAAAARIMATTSGTQRAAGLHAQADRVRNAAGRILGQNYEDLREGETSGLTPTALDRLRLDEDRLEAMAAGLESVASLPDPIGQIVDGSVRPNGLRVSRVRAPLGVIGIIYENRPNVTSDAAGLCIRSANAAFLRSSSTAMRTNIAVVEALQAGLADAGLPRDAVVLVEDGSHEVAARFMQLRGVIDLLIPRGGPSLIASMLEHATVPYVLDGDGNCHVYVDESADLDMAISIIANAKTQRPGVCNAMESLVVHEAVASAVLRRMEDEVPSVRLLGDERARALSSSIEPASEADFSTEFLDLIATVTVVDDLDGALAHIARHGSGHTEAIVTANVATAERFLAEVDASAVVLNASTRFVDGGELGLGAEVGISTQKIHARGPMGLEALTSVRWVIRGEGQVRT
jgi:glutamate-5-semialdehyde dehydrogenase